MSINHKFTKNERLLLVNISMLTIIALVGFIAFIGINEYTSFYEGILNILFISIYSPLGLILLGMVGAYVYIIIDLFLKVHEREKTRKDNKIKKYSKIEYSIIILEIINLIILIGGYCYIFFIAQPKYDRDVQNARNESMLDKYETNSELIKFKCKIFPENDPAKNFAEAIKLSKSGKVDMAVQQLNWAVEKMEVQRSFLQKMKTPSKEWEKSINNILMMSTDKEAVDPIDQFKDDIKDLDDNKYNLNKEDKQNYIMMLASPDFEMQTFQKQITNLFAKVKCD